MHHRRNGAQETRRGQDPPFGLETEQDTGPRQTQGPASRRHRYARERHAFRCGVVGQRFQLPEMLYAVIEKKTGRLNMQLDQIRVAIIAADGFEESELTEPMRALKEAGGEVDVVSLKSGEIQAMKHHDKSSRVKVDQTLAQVSPGDYDAVMLPGGALNADTLRVEPKLQQFLRSFDQDDKPMAIICHAPWELISAGLVRGRKLAAYHTIHDDIQNAGGIYMDREVVVDRNWVTSRQPSDLPAFNHEMLKLFAHAAAPAR